jgi:hypothetical protein
LNALCSIRNGLEAGLGDFPAALLALAITSIFDPFDGRFNLIEGVLLIPQHTNREFLIGIVTPNLLSVGWYAGGPAVGLQGIVFYLRHVTEKACPQGQESFPMKHQVSVRHFVELSRIRDWVGDAAQVAADIISSPIRPQ